MVCYFHCSFLISLSKWYWCYQKCSIHQNIKQKRKQNQCSALLKKCRYKIICLWKPMCRDNQTKCFFNIETKHFDISIFTSSLHMVMFCLYKSSCLLSLVLIIESISLSSGFSYSPQPFQLTYILRVWCSPVLFCHPFMVAKFQSHRFVWLDVI
jgi:hypothetical protein